MRHFTRSCQLLKCADAYGCAHTVLPLSKGLSRLDFLFFIHRRIVYALG